MVATEAALRSRDSAGNPHYKRLGFIVHPALSSTAGKLSRFGACFSGVLKLGVSFPQWLQEYLSIGYWVHCGLYAFGLSGK